MNDQNSKSDGRTGNRGDEIQRYADLPRSSNPSPGLIWSAPRARAAKAGLTLAGIVLLVALGAGLALLLQQRTLAGRGATPTAEAPAGDYPLLGASTPLSQTVEGYTVTIGPLPQFGRSADANAVILPYRVTNQQG